MVPICVSSSLSPICVSSSLSPICVSSSLVPICVFQVPRFLFLLSTLIPICVSSSLIPICVFRMKEDETRRRWSKDEEELLIECVYGRLDGTEEIKNTLLLGDKSFTRE